MVYREGVYRVVYTGWCIEEGVDPLRRGLSVSLRKRREYSAQRPPGLPKEEE